MNVLIKRNAKIPCEATKIFTNNTDYCELIEFKIYQGERTLVRDCTLIGQFDLSGFGNSVKGTERIKTTFSMNADGILKVDAKNAKPGAPSANIDIKSNATLT